MRKSFKSDLKAIKIPTVTITIFGKRYRFLVDTGSTTCHLFPSSLDRIKEGRDLKIVGQRKMLGAEGIHRMLIIYEIPYSFNRRKMCEHFYTIPNNNGQEQFEEEAGIRIDGILGFPFLSKNNLVIDYVNQELYDSAE